MASPQASPNQTGAGVELIAIADDATGALEIGAQLANAGIISRVVFGSAISGSDARGTALVVDTETRHIDGPIAARRVARIAARALAFGVRHVYKKTDSTLRGNIGAEFAALLRVFPERTLVYVPAYPKLGRTVTGGVLRIDGKPLSETAFAADRRNPSQESSIPRLLRESVEDIARVTVCDGESDADLERIAAVLARDERPAIVAGAGGFAGYWAQAISITRGFHPPAPAPSSRVLICSGSLHPVSARQLECARRAGLGVHCLETDSRADESVAQSLVESIAGIGYAALTVSRTARGDPAEIAARLGLVASRAVKLAGADALVVFGGDTVFAILNALRVKAIEPCGEVLPGVPVSGILLRGRKVQLVTKAGGFGEPDILEVIRRHLEKAA